MTTFLAICAAISSFAVWILITKFPKTYGKTEWFLFFLGSPLLWITGLGLWLVGCKFWKGKYRWN